MRDLIGQLEDFHKESESICSKDFVRDSRCLTDTLSLRFARKKGATMNVSMKKMIGLFAIAVVLVFIEGMFPEKKRTKALPYRYRAKAVN